MFNFGSKRRQATTVAAALGVLAFGGVLASAASLGTVSGDSLGVGVTTVASCDTDGITLGYSNTFDNTAGTYIVTAVNVSNINVGPGGCLGKVLDVTLKDNTGAAIGNGSLPVGGPMGQTVTILGNSSAASVVGAAVVISD
jgi:hypothetical protein